MEARLILNKLLTALFVYLGVYVGLFCAHGAYALELELGVSGSTVYTDNALRVGENAPVDPLSERQDTYGVGLSAFHDDENLRFNADYLVTYTVFNEDSQQDREMRNGQAILFLGRTNGLFTLELENTIQQILVDPSGVAISENLDERSISSARPGMNFRLSDVDRFTVGGTYSQVRFDLEEGRNSTREGGFAQWTHQLSALSSFVLSASEQDVQFDYFPLASYKVRYLTLGYSASLRRLQYSIVLGANETESANDPDTFREERYNIDFLYTVGRSQFGLRLSKEITDSSRGNNNLVALNEDDIENLPQGSFGNAGQIDFQQGEIFWNSQFLCADCSVSLSSRLAKEEYLTFSDQDNEQLFHTIRMTYQLNRRTALDFQLGEVSREFYSQSERDFEAKRLEFVYRYALMQSLDLRVSASTQIREDVNTDNGEIKERLYGLALEYRY